MATATRARMNPRFSVHSDRLVRAVALSAGFVTANGRGASKLPADYAARLSGVILPASDWRDQVGVHPEQKYHELAGVPGVWEVEVRPSVKSGAPRFFVKCPGCGQEAPTGRLHQHIFMGSPCADAFDSGPYAASVWYREDGGTSHMLINPASRKLDPGIEGWAMYDAAVHRTLGGEGRATLEIVHTRALMEYAEPIHETEVPADVRETLLDLMTR